MGSVQRTAVCVLLLAACGGDDSGGGGHADAAPTSDSHSVDGPAGACLPGTYDIDKEWGFTKGPYAITGTITLPAALQMGRGIQLNMLQVSPMPGNTIDFAFVTATKSSVTYRARGLVDGTWRICLRADADGNSMLNDTGVDYTGCFDGTVAAPIKDTSAAAQIALGGACQSGKDFGIGMY